MKTEDSTRVIWKWIWIILGIFIGQISVIIAMGIGMLLNELSYGP